MAGHTVNSQEVEMKAGLCRTPAHGMTPSLTFSVCWGGGQEGRLRQPRNVLPLIGPLESVELFETREEGT